MEDRQAYDTDLTDTEWNRLEPLVPAPKPGGRPPQHTRREIVNLLRDSQRRRVKTAAPRSAPLADGLSLLLVLAPRRDLGANP